MSNVIYSNARAKALSNTLLRSERINRMIESSPEEALKILGEVNFGNNIPIESILDFEKLISQEKNTLNDFIKTSSPNSNIKEFFLIKNDFHNAESFIKEKYLKLDSSSFIIEDGVYEKNFLKEKIMTDDYKKLSSYLEKALLICDNDFVNGTATGQSVNNAFEISYFENLCKLSSGNKILKEIYKSKVDFANVSIALRSRNYQNAKDFFLKGGRLNEFDFKMLCEESFDLLKEKFKFNKNSEIILKAIESTEKHESLFEYEKLSESYAVSYLEKFKFDISNSIPFIQYVYYKLADIYNVRIILVGLINKLPKNDIKNRLRAYYEG